MVVLPILFGGARPVSVLFLAQRLLDVQLRPSGRRWARA